jgi:hypothetical protein
VTTTVDSVRRYLVELPAKQLDDLRSRIAATRWPERETVTDDSQGVPLALMQDLAQYWATSYDMGTLQQITGRPPRPVAEFLHEHRAEFL